MSDPRTRSRWVGRAAAAAAAWVFGTAGGWAGQGGKACAQTAFATRIVEYVPAPGQFVRVGQFSDPSRALGPPVGGGVDGADNSNVVTLGGFGGFITLGFERVILDDARNPMGLDFIVFGNAFWAGGNAGRRWGEPGVVEVCRDVNGNGEADDAWYVIRGSHVKDAAASWWVQEWDDDVGDATRPPMFASWIPEGRSGVWTSEGMRLRGEVFENASGVVENPNGDGAEHEGVWGYADMSPVLVLGDLDGDGVVDDEELDAEEFYTRPDDPLTVGVTPGSGGGDAFDIAWAVDPVTGEPAGLDGVDFIRIRSGVMHVRPLLGEVSTEVGGAAMVVARLATDWDGNGVVTAADVGAFLTDYFADLMNGTSAADFDGNGVVNPADVGAFLSAWFEER